MKLHRFCPVRRRRPFGAHHWVPGLHSGKLVVPMRVWDNPEVPASKIQYAWHRALLTPSGLLHINKDDMIGFTDPREPSDNDWGGTHSVDHMLRMII